MDVVLKIFTLKSLYHSIQILNKIPQLLIIHENILNISKLVNIFAKKYQKPCFKKKYFYQKQKIEVLNLTYLFNYKF